MSLFGGAAGAAGGGGGPEYLHSFKAGRCDFDSETKTVTPTPAKGLLFIQKAPDIPGMMQIGWRNRETGELVDNHLTCNDAKFVPCKSAGEARVFYLKFENNRRCFFWMQDKESNEDMNNATKLNDYIEGKAASADAGAAGGAGGLGGFDLSSLGIGEEEIQAINALPPAERDEFLMQLGLAPPTAGTGLGDIGGGPVLTPAAHHAPSVPPPVMRNPDPDHPGDSDAVVPPPQMSRSGDGDEDEDEAEEEEGDNMDTAE
eukprot:m.171653 g.171653  ORF g.171653 m.171653 type:complete len:259 (+) comp13401_c0_seq1:152-928(+)